MPVGAITVACALRKPCFSPSASAASQLRRAPPRRARGPGSSRRRAAPAAIDERPHSPRAVVRRSDAMGGAAMVADDPQHRLAVLGITGEGAELARHLGRGGITRPGHQRGDRAAERAAGVAVVRRCPSTSTGRRDWRSRGRGCGSRSERRAISFDGNCAISTEISSTIVHSRTACSKAGDIEAAVLPAERHQVEGGEIARRVVEEHVFRARVRGVDPAALGAGVPVVDRRVELQAGIGRGPGGMADLVPQLARRQRSWRSCRRCAGSAARRRRCGPARENRSEIRTELFEFCPATVR